MSRLITLILCLCTMPAFSKGQFGAPITLTQATNLGTAIETAANQELLISGTVEKVCQKKGCWMTLKDTSKDIRVTFKDYKFFVPFSLIGKKVLVQGKIKKETESVATQRHYLEDAGKSKQEIEAITTPKTTYSLIASGVRVL